MKKLLAAVTVLIVSTAQAGPGEIYVDIAKCPGPGDGSIGNPYCSIQTAIVNAVDGGYIVVAEGIYVETIDFLGKAIIVRSTDPGNPTVVANTVIDGTGNPHVVQCVSGEGSGTVLEGFTITGGNALNGGGVYNVFSSPIVSFCTFTANSAGSGGGMYNSASSPLVIFCTFVGNTASIGGGIFSFNGSNPTVIGCSFCNNDPDDISGPYVDGGGNDFECPSGACCTNDSCIVLPEATCIVAGGTYQGDNTICEASTCPTPCPADVDGDGTVGITDFLDVLGAWGACP